MVDKLTSKSRKDEEPGDSEKRAQSLQMPAVDQIRPEVVPQNLRSSGSGADFMSPILETEDGTLSAPASSEIQEFPDQIAPELAIDFINQMPEEKYIRLQLHVENGEISVIGARSVPGPLISEERLQGEIVYEVSTGQKLLAAGSLPTLGEARGLPHPEGTPEQQMHHITELSSDEFTVRIPQEELSLELLPDLQITVYRAKAGAPDQFLTSQPLSFQFGERLREVARLQGIHLAGLPEGVQRELRQAFQ